MTQPPPSPTVRTVRWAVAGLLGLIVCLALLTDAFVRLSHNPAMAESNQFVAEHGNIAAALVHGEGFANPFGTESGPTAWVPPVYPLYLALIFLLFGVKSVAAFKALVALDALLAGLTVVGTCVLLDFAGLGRAKGLFTVTLLLLHFLDVHVGGFAVTTRWFVMAENAWLLACACGAYYQGSSGWRMGLALLCGVIPLTHAGSGAAAAAVVALFGVAIFVRLRKEGTALRASLLSFLDYILVPAACFLFTVGLWTARNWVEFRQFVPLKSAGWFEVYLTQVYTSNGVITDATMVAHHPYSNPKLLVDYTMNGETLFLKAFEPKAKAAIAADKDKYYRGIVGRAENVFSYCEFTFPLALCTVRLDPVDARKLVAADLASRLSQPVPVWWTSLDLPPKEFHKRLAALDVGPKQALETNWLDAKAASIARSTSLPCVLLGLSLAGIPTLAILLTIGLRRMELGLALGAAWLFYGVAVLPNVLITHYAAHSQHFRAFHALAIACALTFTWDVLARRKAAAKPPV